MFKKFIYLISFILVLALTGNILAQEPDAQIPPAGSPEPVIDGIREDIWLVSEEHEIPYNNVGEDPVDDMDCSGTWWALWDIDYLYLYVDVKDEDLQNDSGESWQDDSVEIYVDAGNDKLLSYGADDYQYRAAWNVDFPEIQEYHHGSTSLPGVEFIVSETDDGYALEIKFPWEALYIDGSPALNDLMGFTVMINDDDAGDNRETQLAWQPNTADAWQDPSMFGTVQLVAGFDNASNPLPRHGTENVTEALLQWTPGESAQSHNVYFGTNPTPGEEEFMENITEAEYQPPEGLEPMTTYYWRIDEVEADGSVHTGAVWSFASAPLTAHSPDPCDGAQWIELDANLSWGMGLTAQTHDVYFGTDEAAVTDADESSEEFKGNQEQATFEPGLLDAKTTFFWRIDEVEEDSVTKHKGDVWSFTALGAGAGIKGEYFANANLSGDPVFTQTDSLIDFDWGQEAPDEQLGTDNFSIRWTAELEIPDTDTYTFFTIRDVSDGIRLWIDGRLIIDDWDGGDVLNNQGVVDLYAGTASLMMEYYDSGGGAMAHLSWQTDSIPRQIISKGMFSLPIRAVGARPATGEEEVHVQPTLRWIAGDGSAEHDVYFGTDYNDVLNADNTTPVIYRGRQALERTSYIPSENPLQWNTTYYWRIDEYNTNGTIIVGNVWSFTTGNFILIEDFEDYNDFPPDQIWNTWYDGYMDPTNGSTAGYPDPDFLAGEHYMEGDIVHGGDWSMPFFYDNSAGLSEVSRSLGSSLRNWTRDDVVELELYYIGYPASVGSFTEGPTGTYTMIASGSDIWGTTDEFHFAYKQMSGVGSIIAKVESVEETDTWAKAGVMIRNSLSPDSSHVSVYVTAAEGVSFQRRIMANTETSDTTEVDITAPLWVKIEYDISGNFTASYSANGSAWTRIGSETVSMGATVYVGLALTSHDSSATCEARFSNVNISGNVTQQEWMNQDIGITSNEAEPMYVVLNNNAVVYHEDPDAALMDEWTLWRIDLQEFANKGVNLTNVNNIGIGFGNKDNPQPGGLGLVFFDDIRLNRQEP
jgi:hypothetical protein